MVLHVNEHMPPLEQVFVIQDIQNQVPIVIRIQMHVVRPYVEHLLVEHVDAFLEP